MTVRVLTAVRPLCLALLLVAAVGCNDKKEPESVEKYCALTSMPHSTAIELRALQGRAIALFQERKPYRTTAANRAVVNAASQVSVTASTYAIQLEQPRLFPGQPKGMGFPEALAQLADACADLPSKP